MVEKIAYSAFHMSRFEWMLKKAGITDLIFGGIVTNGGVTSTARDAHVHGYHCTILEDGCAAFDPDVHNVSIEALKSIADITTCDEIISRLN